MSITSKELLRRLRNWKTIVAILSLVGFIAIKSGHAEVNSTINEALPYIYAVGISLGIITSHGVVVEEDENEKGEK